METWYKEWHFMTFVLAIAVYVGYHLYFHLISLPEVCSCSDRAGWGWGTVLDIRVSVLEEKSQTEGQTSKKK